MPTVLDATVVASAYDTSGNGGRKLVRLDNGWLVASAKTTTYIYFQVSKDNGLTWSQLCYLNLTVTINDFSIVNKGNFIHAIIADANGNNQTVYSLSFDASTQTNVDIFSVRKTIVTEITIGNVSLAINEQGTELHATWASKNSNYPYNFNIRYAKGAINADGTLTWGAVEQVTTLNQQSRYIQNPTLTLDANGIPVILCEVWQSLFTGGTITNTGYGIYAIKKDRSLSYTGTYVHISWSMGGIVIDNSYAQSYPSAIFIPSEINGLPNGRIWVAWQGLDSTDSGTFNLRYSYSDDGGITWSVSQKLTTGNTGTVGHAEAPFITANKNNEIFILFIQGSSGVTNYKRVKMIKNTNGAWGEVTSITSNTTNHAYFPSALFDLSIDFTEPLFIYQNNQAPKVGFYGSWTIINISLQEGDIGNVLNKNSLRMYSITTDGTMSTVTEKINGNVIATKNLTSGQSTSISLTDEQWNNINYGKYDFGYDKIKYFPHYDRGEADSYSGSVWTDGFQSELFGGTLNFIFRESDFIGKPMELRLISQEESSASADAFVKIEELEWDDRARDYRGINTLASEVLPRSTDNPMYIRFEATKIFRVQLSNDTGGSDSGEFYIYSMAFSDSYKRNELTIEMGSNKWNYTFEKKLANNDSLVNIAKAIKDTNNFQLPAIKDMLVDKIGGSKDSTFEEIISNGSYVKKWAKGNTTIVYNAPYLTISGLSFKPSIVVLSSAMLDGSVNMPASNTNRIMIIDVLQGGFAQANVSTTYSSNNYGLYVKSNAVNWDETTGTLTLAYAPNFSSNVNFYAFE